MAVIHASWVGWAVSDQKRRDSARSVTHTAAMPDRYTLRPDARGFTVLDLDAGTAAQIASQPQSGLSREDAEHTVELLNKQDATLKASRAA